MADKKGGTTGGGNASGNNAGNAGWPAKTGNDSGKGRDNNPPKNK